MALLDVCSTDAAASSGIYIIAIILTMLCYGLFVDTPKLEGCLQPLYLLLDVYTSN